MIQNFEAKTIFISEFRKAAETVGIKEVDVLLGAVAYLGGGELRLIELRYEYYEAEAEIPDVIELDRLQAAAALKRNINPISGRVEEGVAERIMTHYRPTQRLIDVAKGGASNA